MQDSGREERILAAVASAQCLKHPRAQEHMEIIGQFWDLPTGQPTRHQACARNQRAYRRRICLGNLAVDGEMRPFTGGFFHGLRLGGALRASEKSHRHWRLHGPVHKALEEDLECMPLPGSLGRPDVRGRRFVRSCPALLLPPSDSLGADVLAGVYAAALWRRHENQDFLAVPSSFDLKLLLEAWCLWHVSTGLQTLLSPFYGVLLGGTGWLPFASYSRLLGATAPAGCPLLPLMVYNLAFVPRGKFPDRAWRLPFLVSHATRCRKGWSRQELHRLAVKEGIARVPLRLRLVLDDFHGLGE
jgi:hypothetical protein